MDTKARNVLIAALAVFIIAIVPRLGAVHSPFLFDDFHAAVRNPAVTGKATIWRIFTDPSAFSSSPGRRMYRPVTLLSYRFSHRIGGSDPFWWHVFNLLIHGVNALLVFGIGWRLFNGKTMPAACAAAFWAAHPLLNEAIIYQAARSSLLAATALLAGIYSHLSIKKGGPRAVVVCVWMLIGLGCKETVAVAPVLLALFDLPGGNLRNRRQTYVATAAILIFYILMRRAALGVDTFVVSHPVRSVTSNLLTQSTIIPAYILAALLPMRLSVEWSWPAAINWWPSRWFWWQAPMFCLPLISILAATAIAGYRRYPFFTLGVGCFLVALAPESSIIPLVQTANERRLYFPLVGFGILCAWLLHLQTAHKRLYGAAAVVIAVCFTILSTADVSRWSSAERLWESALKRSPSSLMAMHGLASARLDAKKIESAEKLYRKLLKEHPEYGGGHLGFGRIMLRKKRFDEAEKHFIFAMQLDPNNDGSWINLSNLYLQWGKLADAENAARKGVDIFPRSARLWNNFGAALAGSGKLEEALEAFGHALEIDPNYATAAANRKAALLDLRRRTGGKSTPKK